MPTKITIPELGDSITHGVIQTWRKAEGDIVKRDEIILDLETDKITVELPAPAAGAIKHLRKVGDKVAVGEVIGEIDEKAAAAASSPAASAPAASAPATAASAPAAPRPPSAALSNGARTPAPSPAPAVAPAADIRATPLARKIAQEHGVDLGALAGTGAGGRVREHDVLTAVSTRLAPPAAAPSAPSAASAKPALTPSIPIPPPGSRNVRREPMSMLRQRVASRLVEAQHTAAMLTTFNECDMTAVMDLRKKFKESFEKKHGVGLGFMSFFVKAVANALRAFPAVNASIVSDAKGGGGAEPSVEFHDYADIALAVGTPKGLVVPVLRNAESLSFAQIESGVKDLATKARDNKLSLADMQGGTFTVTNGGIYGSLMSTPILNPPQSGILGMHAIKNRAVEHPAASGQVAIRPMMYLALSYDHRLVDGAGAVQFLVAVKDAIETPERLLLEV